MVIIETRKIPLWVPNHAAPPVGQVHLRVAHSQRMNHHPVAAITKPMPLPRIRVCQT